MKTAADQIAVIGTLASGATVSIHVREAVAGGTGFLWEINGADGTLRITAGAPYPGIFPLTVAGAQGSDEPAGYPGGVDTEMARAHQPPRHARLQRRPCLRRVAADIGNETHVVPDFADAVPRHEVIDAIERSAASGKRIKP